MNQKEFARNAVAVCAVSLCMNILGIVFRTYVSNRVGSETMGLLQLVMSVYLPACTLASSGVYVASTRLCAAALARNDRRVRDILTSCLQYGLCFGICAFLLLFLGADTISKNLLSYPQAGVPLKILSFGLPFLSASNALQGFFLSLRKASYSTVLQVTEDFFKIAATVYLFSLFSKQGPATALCAMVAGIAVGEIFSCLCGYILYLRKSARLCAPRERAKENYLTQVAKIALPCAFGGYLRTGIGMIENILVPKGLEASGLTAEQTLAALGKFEGMALPLLIFPASFLAVVSKLLVPEIAAERAIGNDAENKKTTENILTWTVTYAIFIACFAFLFGKNLGEEVYSDPTCGAYLTRLAPLVPILYADRVTDGMMKGYDRQITTVKINLLDTAVRTLGALFILPKTGIEGYIGIFCAGTVLNFILSFLSLKRAGNIRFPFLRGVLRGGLAALAALLPIKIIEMATRLSVWAALGIGFPLFLLFAVGLSNGGERHLRSLTRSIRNS